MPWKSYFFFICFLYLFVLASFCEEVKWIKTLQAAITDCEYIFCIDGGGSRTTLEILDRKGQKVALENYYPLNRILLYQSSNINSVGQEGLKHVIQAVFQPLLQQKLPLKKIDKKCAVVAGIAGLSSPKNQKIASGLFEQLGFDTQHIVTMSDAELSLEIVGEKGIVLIAGTGCVADGRDHEETKRAGGLGRLIGDEGSGYYIGMQAIKRALEEELGYGQATILTSAIKKHFNVDKMYDLVTPIHLGEVSVNKIASVAELVLLAYKQEDIVAKQIVDQATEHLGTLLKNLLVQLKDSTYDVYVIGGLFRSDLADLLIEKIRHTPTLVDHLQATGQQIVFHNIANQSLAALAVQTLLQRKS